MIAVTPHPGVCSDLFASGWRVAQSHLDAGFGPDVDGPIFDLEEKFNGYIERMATERRARTAGPVMPVLRPVADDAYIGEGGVTMSREYGLTPKGKRVAGTWVLRSGGRWVDFDRHRCDLAERHGMRVENDDVPAESNMEVA